MVVSGSLAVVVINTVWSVVGEGVREGELGTAEVERSARELGRRMVESAVRAEVVGERLWVDCSWLEREVKSPGDEDCRVTVEETAVLEREVKSPGDEDCRVTVEETAVLEREVKSPGDEDCRVTVEKTAVERRSADVKGSITVGSIGRSIDDIITERSTDDVIGIGSTDDSMTGSGLLNMSDTVWTTMTGEDSGSGVVARTSTTPVETEEQTDK